MNSVLCALAAALLTGCTQRTPDAAAGDPAPPRTADGPPRTSDRSGERKRMVRSDIRARGVIDPRVLDALRAVPRHWFVPDRYAAAAYDDGALPIGEGQTISQPYIVALMTEALELEPGSKVLEIGTGSGYQAAVLSEITPHVFTIEIVAPLAARAQELFAERGYTTIRGRTGDGYQGWPEQAPFDAVIVTAAPGHVPPALFEQLAVGGRLCLPLGPERGAQRLLVITKRPDGTRSERELAPVRFVPMTGEARQRR